MGARVHRVQLGDFDGYKSSRSRTCIPDTLPTSHQPGQGTARRRSRTPGRQEHRARMGPGSGQAPHQRGAQDADRGDASEPPGSGRPHAGRSHQQDYPADPEQALARLQGHTHRVRSCAYLVRRPPIPSAPVRSQGPRHDRRTLGTRPGVAPTTPARTQGLMINDPRAS